MAQPRPRTAPAGAPPPNDITPRGYARSKAELTRRRDVERPGRVRGAAWAASDGDRSESGDDLYGKKRLREIDILDVRCEALD
jgi:transcription elongation factor GreB